MSPSHTSDEIELLAPGKDVATARAAILCGADAVYIGAERFSAREAAGNSMPAIQQTTDFAHQYYAKVYVALNTLLYDNELPLAEKLIHQYYKMGVDGLIIQDVGLLELDLPPLPLIASTQMHNATPEKVKFWQDVGFSRVILARELSLEQIRHIRRQTSIELECFIHGALCVGASGQCYMSYALGGRSGNRGQCAQPCRRLYSLKDRHGKTIVKDRYLLSLKDLNLADHIEDLIDAGVGSFKIEGRLKDIPYVANTVSVYRQRLDSILAKKNLHLSSSGSVQLNFQPNLKKTFNRGFTDYGLTGRASSISSMDTPKSIGEFMGVVTDVAKSFFVLDGDMEMHNADGICFFDRQKNLCGTVVNRIEGRLIYPQKTHGINVGQKIYRNYDHQFHRTLTNRAAQRKVRLKMILQETPKCVVLTGTDEDGNQATVEIAGEKRPALKKQAMMEKIRSQLMKLGNTIFDCFNLRLQTQDVYFLPVSQLNAAKRELVQCLLRIREANRPHTTKAISKNDIPYPEKHLTYMGNVLNSKARAFYHRHGVGSIEPAAESGMDLSGRLIMTTKYCLRKELKMCPGLKSKSTAEPLILQDEDGREYELRFRCNRCGMEIYFPSGAKS
ncbi:MAG: U32 family peptidase [Sedimentisphaerales bacterium]|nr:U32 family peptidase [Sedimentisphaerales bacterium]